MSKKKLLLPYRSRITTDASENPNQKKTQQNVIIFSNFSSSVCQNHKRNRQIQSRTENGSKRDYFFIVSIVRAITAAENTTTHFDADLELKKEEKLLPLLLLLNKQIGRKRKRMRIFFFHFLYCQNNKISRKHNNTQISMQTSTKKKPENYIAFARTSSRRTNEINLLILSATRSIRTINEAKTHKTAQISMRN